MRAKAQKSGGTAEGTTKTPIASSETGDAAHTAEKKIKFRNYQPYDNTLKKNMRTEEVKAEQEDHATPVSGEVETDVIKRELKQFQDNELNIMPKKPNWDLKVQVEGKLLKLKNRTQKAIVEILREKLANDSGDEQ